MNFSVQKYGGSSVASAELIKKIAQRIVDRYQSGEKQIIVVSAMGKTTNDLKEKAYSITKKPDKRELDMLLSVGERLSISLMCMAINDIVPNLAVSYTGSQIGLITNCNHTDARIVEIKGDRLKIAVSEGKIPVIAGFQGVSTNKEITTLGRGGSDTTAVAVCAAVGADVCEIYSDVDAVYTSDPRLVKEAKPIDKISYDEMLEMASLGAKILKDDAVEYAKRLGVTLSSGLSSNGYIGTIVSDYSLDKNAITSLVYYDKLKYTVKNIDISEVPDIRFYQKVENSNLVIVDDKYDIEENNCVSLSLVGCGVRKQSSIIKEIYSTLLPFEVLAVQTGGLSYEIFTKKSIPSDILSQIHRTVFK